MNKAFLFDLDGVLINSEPIWQIETEVVYSQLYGSALQEKLGPTMGLGLEVIHKNAVGLGSTVHYADFLKAMHGRAAEVYRNAQLTPGIQDLKHELDRRGFHLGIVSASPSEWIAIVLKRLNWEPSEFKIVLSLHDKVELAHKPSPEGYIHAMNELGAAPTTTLILEDSNTGIQAAKASGATVIGFRQFLLKDYQQKGADLYANNVEDIIKIVREFKG